MVPGLGDRFCRSPRRAGADVEGESERDQDRELELNTPENKQATTEPNCSLILAFAVRFKPLLSQGKSRARFGNQAMTPGCGTCGSWR